MAYYDIIVKAVDQTKSTMQGVQRGLENVEKQTKRTNDALGKMGDVIQGIAASAAALKIVELAKNFGDLEARVRAVSGSGANTAAVMKQLGDTASRLGISLQDAAGAFSILKANGIDTSYDSLQAWTKLAITSGQSVESIADAVANAYQGSFGKISKATEDLIQVEEKYGQYEIKVAGSILARTTSTKQAVDIIKKYTQENAAFADAFIEKQKGITAAVNRLSATITGDTGWKSLGDAIGNIIDKFNKLLQGSGTVGKALDYLARAVNFVGDNFETISTIVSVLGSIFIAGKLFQGIKLIGGMLLNLGNSVRSIGYVFKDMGSLFGGLFTNLAAQWKSWFTQITGSTQAFTGVFDVIARAIFVTLGTLVKNIGSIVKNLAAPFAAMASYFTGLFDPVLEKLAAAWEWMKKITGLGGSKPAPSGNLSGNYNFPDTAGGGRGNVNPPMATPADAGSNPGIDLMQKYLAGFAETIGETRSKFAALTKAFANTRDIDVASAMFKELSSQAETLGRVLEKPTSLIERDYAMSIKKAAEELRQHEVELKNTTLTQQKWDNELKATILELEEQAAKLKDNVYMQTYWYGELAKTNLALQEQEAKLKDAGIQATQFQQLLKQTNLDTEQQKITLALLNEEYAKGAMPLSTYVKLLGGIDSTLLGTAEKFAQFRQELSNGEKAWADNFYLANETFKLYQNGQLTLKELALAVNNLGEEYFDWNALLKVGLDQAREAVNADTKRKFMLEQLTEQFKKGAVAADVYRKAAGNLGADSEATDRMVNVYGKAVDKMRENNEFLKKSISDAATTFSKEFTEAFVNMKNPLNAFKNLFGNILNDIATRMVKQHLADPLADTMSQVLNEIMGTGSGKGGVAQIMTEGAVKGGDGMIEAFKGAGTKIMESMGSMGSGITNLFSGMGDSLMSIFGDVFSWISSNASSLGSSLSSLLGGLGGGGGLSGLFGSIGDFFAGWFADGGTIPSGQFGIVGEAGPEIVTGPANITPMNVDSVNSASDEGSDGGLTVNFQLYAIDTQSGVQFLLQNKPAIISMVGEAYNRRGRRGPLD